MGLLSNPLTLNDGVPAARIFSYRSQRPDNRSVIGDYVENAASAAANSLITIKHDLRATAAPRALVQRVIKLVPAAGTELMQITMNFTLVASNLFTAAEIDSEFTLFQDLLAEADLISGLRLLKI